MRRADAGRRRGPMGVAHWSARHPWRALGAWLVVVAVCVGAGTLVGTRLMTDAEAGVGESGRADEAVAAAPFAPATQDEFALVRRVDGNAITSAQAAAVGAALRRALAAADGVRGVHPVGVSAGGRAALVAWEVDDADGNAATRVVSSQDAVASVRAAFPPFVIEQTGGASIERDMKRVLSGDFSRAERRSLPLTFLILLVVFGAVVAALVPLALSLTAIAAAFGIASLVSQGIPQSEMLSSMLLLVGIAVGVDYSLFLVRRFRDERAAGRDRREAVGVAVDTAGHAVLVSGVTVVVAMASMMLSFDPTFTSMGVACVSVVACAVAGALLALPAVLVLMGDRLNWLPVPVLGRVRARDAGASRFWGAVAGAVVRRPRVALAASAGALALLAAPVAGMSLKMPGYADLPRDRMPSMAAYDRMQQAFPQEGSAHRVVVVPDGGRTMDSPDVRAGVGALTAAARRDGAFASGRWPAVDVSRDRAVGIVTLPYRGDYATPQAARSLATLRAHLVPAALGDVADAYVTGNAASVQDFSSLVRNRLPVMMAFVVLVTFAVMLMSFGSAWLAAATVALNGLSVAAAYGFLVLVFQHGWFDGVAGIHSNGGVVTWLPMFLFVILFGLSMDYHVFVLSRVREAASRGAGAREAIVHGVAHTGSVVTSAAAVMIAAFAVFATLSTVDMKQLGIGLAVAIGLDATLVRGVLLPSALAVLGDRAFGRARRHAGAHDPVADAAASEPA